MHPSSIQIFKKIIDKGSSPKEISFHYDFLMTGYSLSDFNLLESHIAQFHMVSKSVLNAWEKRNHPNMFFTTYEKMKKDIKNVTVELISFLRGSDYIISDENMKNLLTAVDLESFRGNKFVNKTHFYKTDENGHSFIRKGVIGDWKNHFDEEMNKEWDSEIEKQLSGSEFRMIFE